MRLPVILMVSTLLAACGPGVRQDTGSNPDGGSLPTGFSWSARATLPIPRTDHAAVVLGGKLYSIGGFSGSTLAEVDQYDPASNTWTRKRDLQAARREFAAGAVNGKIYVACGMSWTDPNAVTYVKTTEEYDPASDTWTTRTGGCPIDFAATNSVYSNVHIGGAAANGRLYMVVFNVGAPGGTATYEYDPAADKWTSKAPPPFRSGPYSVAELGGSLYALSSQSNGANPFAESRLAQYDPVGDVWIIRAALAGVWWSALVAANGKLDAFGGVVATGGFTSPPGVRATSVIPAVNEYDPATDRWTTRNPFGVARHSAGAVLLGTDVYVLGGSSATNQFAAVPVTAVEASASPGP
jgi:Kelch motif protein